MLLNARPKHVLRIKRYLGLTIANQLNAKQKTPTTDVTNVRMIPESILQQAAKFLPLCLDMGQKLTIADLGDHRKRGSAWRSACVVGVPMNEVAALISDDIKDTTGYEDGRYWLVTGAQALCQGHKVGGNAILLD